MSNSPIFLGVDGGATKTVAVLVDSDGNEIGRGQGSSSNAESVGMDAAVNALQTAIARARDSAHISSDILFETAWLGLAGIDRPYDQEVWEKHVAGLARHLHITNDGALLLSAFPSRVGVALIAGTGSVTWGRNERGETVRVGGWGHVLGDEGSGYIIALHALQVIARMVDGRGPATTLYERVLRAWNLHTIEDIMDKVYPVQNTAEIAQLAIQVFEAAEEQDAMAQWIIDVAGREHALATSTVCRKLDFPEHAPIQIALGGSLFIHQKLLVDSVVKYVKMRYQIESITRVDDAAHSAAQWCAHYSLS
jgi:N-acetylglucosamine kinase-like BadF-type ATPase